MIEDRNLVCAGGLLRMQLDTALRFHAAWLVEDCHEFACEVLQGTRIDKLTDRSGKRLHDFYLVECMSGEDGCDWISRVYRETSGYVHLSDKHLFQTFTSVDEDERTVEVKIGATDHEWPEEIYLEVVDAFLAATRLFVKYLQGWEVTKQNPQEIARLREKRQAKSSET
ncbi:MAG: hypothetical protein IT435_02650 [Phycisphaerales bacterium]|nr:hypothetical protein [Phycisphaerales bacterium]